MDIRLKKFQVEKQRPNPSLISIRQRSNGDKVEKFQNVGCNTKEMVEFMLE